ncbi:amino acid permease [Lacticaseibacillus chiayiensis]|uniref:Amino acid permease n=1 Tax=Lacticaseibacillus chiayiensis TaxID=2100821 RepID=A0A4Q1TLY1_9LACO|nr:amino acid permease [Lacticaseibacillus chiayiensis]QVI35530.1 amino acid permease [Lacticaseibacillus chiayiensis]RXT18995.1 amino acid permease [Lacticaseibacillus chiayiensis]RXT55615.1 amino acid permease [Lacticaseibacillus chiayiensis]UYN57369.1 amino acid permease [Lacticaseibacillus chiayiensis]
MQTEKDDQPELARNLKSRHVQLIAIGGTIGTGLFLGSGQSIHLAGPSILFAYLLTGGICFLLMRALGELLMSDVDTHTFIDFITKYLGKDAGWVTGWTYWICWVALAMAEVTAIGLYIRFWLPDVPQWLPGLIALAVLLLLNLVSVGLFGEAEFWFALIKIVAIIGLIVLGIFMMIVRFKTPLGHASLANLVNDGGLFPKGFGGFLMSLQMVVFSFVGIEMVGLTASETKNPHKVIPEAINEIPMRILLFYVGALFVIMCIYPWRHVSPVNSPFVEVFNNVGIPFAADIINFVVLTAAASACNSSIFSTGRLLFSLTVTGKSQSAQWAAKLSRRQVPARAILISTAVIAVAVVLNLFLPGAVFTLVSSMATISFLFVWAMIMLAHLRYKKLNPHKEGFRMPFYPVSDYLVLGFLLLTAIIMLFNRAMLSALIFAVVWIATLFILRWLRRAAKA